MSQAAAGKKLEIKKYPNRRYYDATRSRHVTLEEINTLIRDGYEIQVTDSKTGKDITPKVLAQIILDLDSPKLDVFPVPLLHRLIRANEQIVTDFVEKYFNQALSAFLDSQRTVEQSLRQAMGLNPAGIPDWTKFMWPFANPLFGGQRSRQADPEPSSAGNGATPREHEEPGANGRDVREAVDDLREQVAALKQQLAEAKKGRK